MTATSFIPIGMGLIVLGAGLGIGKFAAAAAESIARQPEAADKITGAVNLPLFLLEGVALDPSLNQQDGIHPNKEGTIIISKTLQEIIIKNL